MKGIRGGVVMLAVAMLGAGLQGGWAQTVPLAKGSQSQSGAKKENPPAPAPASVAIEMVSQIPPVDRENLKGYWSGVAAHTKERLLQVLPAAAKPPLSTSGEVAILGWIHTDGRVTGMTLEHGSGKPALDRAAWAAITGSTPYEAFPYGIAVDEVKVRFTFEYNAGAGGNGTAPKIIH
jgi:TonB family protein